MIYKRFAKALGATGLLYALCLGFPNTPVREGALPHDLARRLKGTNLSVEQYTTGQFRAYLLKCPNSDTAELHFEDSRKRPLLVHTGPELDGTLPTARKVGNRLELYDRDGNRIW